MSKSNNNNNGSSVDAFESSLNAARKQAIMAGTPYVITKQFPWKLHEMLDVVEQRGETSIVSWLPGGKAFRVHNPNRFVDQIMKKCFNQTKYKSFQRQLNLWGFERIVRESAEKGSYFHPLFLRGRRDLCQEMARQKVKCDKKSSKHHEPSVVSSEESSSRVIPSISEPPKSSSFQLSLATGTPKAESTDGSSSSSATSSPTQASNAASLLLASALPQQLLPPSHLAGPSALHNSLHILNALQAKTSYPSAATLPPAALPASTIASAAAVAAAPVANIPGMTAIADMQLQRQRALENALLVKALENQEAQRASSVLLAAALLGNLASPPKNSS